MTSPTQRKMVLDDPPTLALATVATARHALPGHDEDDIKALWEDGQLLYAWNIGLGTAIEARILPDCIAHYKATGGSRQYPKTEAQVAAILLGQLVAPQWPVFSARRLRILLNCSSGQIYNLIDAKLLSIQPGTTWSTGPSGSATITVASFEKFLFTRRLP